MNEWLILFLALSAGNFVSIKLPKSKTTIGDAFERSAFQGLALLLAYLFI